MKSEKSLIDQITSLLPILGGYMIMYGALNMITYYNGFSIDILQYVSFSEIITYFIKDLYIVLFSVCTIIIVAFYGTYNLKADVEKYNNYVDRYNQYLEKIRPHQEEFRTAAIQPEKKVLLKKMEFDPAKVIMGREWIFRHKEALIGTSIILIIGAGVGFISFKYATWPIILVMCLIVIICFLITTQFTNFKIGALVGIFSNLILISVLSALLQRYNANTGKFSNVSFKISTEVINSDSVNYFIGKTEKYIFYYRSKEKRTIIYSVALVDSLSIPNK